MPDKNNNFDVVVDAYDSILDENAHCDLVPDANLDVQMFSGIFLPLRLP